MQKNIRNIAGNMTSILNRNIGEVKGIGPAWQKMFKQMNICTLYDLLTYYPYKYIDKSKKVKINELRPDADGVVIDVEVAGIGVVGKPPKERLNVIAKDETGAITLVWFKWSKAMRNRFTVGSKYRIYGKPEFFKDNLNIVHPEIIGPADDQNSSLMIEPCYSMTESMKRGHITNRHIIKLVRSIFEMCGNVIEETLPTYLLYRYGLYGYNEAMHNVHFPENFQVLQQANDRLKFDELFYLQLGILLNHDEHKEKSSGFIFTHVGDIFNDFYHNNLPFELTNAQKRVIKEIRSDMLTGKQMNRLLQGDVGSGKTLVALMCMLLAVDNGYQACIMAPTEILANQHYETITKLLGALPVNVSLLMGSTKTSKRKDIHENLLNGHTHIIIGTHALLEDVVQFKNLGLVIIDEQQRFGVVQRSKLWYKNRMSPHVLVMTATPIPRTLAMTVYGDLDVSIIDEMPPGRKPIRTLHMNDATRGKLYELMKHELSEGRQIYIVYPLINESEKMENLKDLQNGFDTIYGVFKPLGYEVVMVHGQMKADEKQASMDLFIENKAQIMVSTTVIEVGVNVPNATVMVIENAERFGLSQLHQLRGRVGRGADKSYCILMSNTKGNSDTNMRINMMVNYSDGFKIAEGDLKLRGPGELSGTMQSGEPFNLKIASLSLDQNILQKAREVARYVLDLDPKLSKPENQVLKYNLQLVNERNKDYTNIS